MIGVKWPRPDLRLDYYRFRNRAVRRRAVARRQTLRLIWVESLGGPHRPQDAIPADPQLSSQRTSISGWVVGSYRRG